MSKLQVDLSGKTALVTGGGSGFGRAFARVLSANGARVCITGRRLHKLEATLDGIAGANADNSLAVVMDVTEPESIAAGFDACEQQLGIADIVVSNAGIARPGLSHKQSIEDFQAVINTNLIAAYGVAREGGRRLIAAEKPGCVVNVASLLAFVVEKGLGAYAASKAGLVQVTRTMAIEWARYGIRVNALAPGYIRTEMNREYFDTEEGKQFITHIPQYRLGTPEELEGPLLLLVSDAGSYMTGSVVTVDGGLSLAGP
jgi:NAD(P)-dependent dehydrogenase (short-subunit alcohol dehydrogenase family)